MRNCFHRFHLEWFQTYPIHRNCLIMFKNISNHHYIFPQKIYASRQLDFLFDFSYLKSKLQLYEKSHDPKHKKLYF